ncbi:MAG: polyhydroxyalkanoic acid system family protein, partial [Myxococcales bacterium]|nr:polyhydroxyalkanoic acid system family protein [Myxococcales bacterium]
IRSIVENVVSEYPKLGLKAAWSPDGAAATATGKGFTGQFRVDASTISVRAELSLIALPFRARVESTLTKKLDEAFPEQV